MTQPEPSPISPKPAEPSWGQVLAYPAGFLGAVLGAVAGGFLVQLASERFYVIPLIGLTVGYGTILLARRGGVVLAILAGVICLAASIVAEWKNWPFRADPGFGYFLEHVLDLPRFSLLLHGVGAVIAFYIPFSTPPRKAGASPASGA